MTDSPSLIPIEERVVDFYGDAITALLVPGDPQPDIYIPLRPLCDYLGLNWSGQLQRLRRDEILGDALKFVCLTHTNPRGGDPEVVCLPLEYLPGWLFGITTSRVRPELQPKIAQYRRECFRVLWRTFESDALSALGQREMALAPPATGTTNLLHIRELGLAVAQMAEQQLALEQRVTAHDIRLNGAAGIIKEVQRRLTAIEEHVAPSATISDAQAAELANLVKAIATELSARDKTKNLYQSVFGELYRRFRVSSYKRVRQHQFAEVMAFLEEMYSAVR
ncbi:MAG: ORF6C domain-containing protein [Chloroflexota bacterium]|nr:ORF6C domain-containing protein [Chloroflexota bacterium]